MCRNIQNYCFRKIGYFISRELSQSDSEFRYKHIEQGFGSGYDQIIFLKNYYDCSLEVKWDDKIWFIWPDYCLKLIE